MAILKIFFPTKKKLIIFFSLLGIAYLFFGSGFATEGIGYWFQPVYFNFLYLNDPTYRFGHYSPWEIQPIHWLTEIIIWLLIYVFISLVDKFGKKVFAPDKIKISIFLIIISIFSLSSFFSPFKHGITQRLKNSPEIIIEAEAYGLPFIVFDRKCVANGPEAGSCSIEIFKRTILSDLILFYLVSCLITSLISVNDKRGLLRNKKIYD